MAVPTYVSDQQLAIALGSDVTAALTQIADRTNELVDEEWTAKPDDFDPGAIPARVKNIAHNAAMRVASNPKGLTSWTRSWDDITRTERIEGARRLGLYLTDDERAELNGSSATTRVVKSIRMYVPRWGF